MHGAVLPGWHGVNALQHFHSRFSRMRYTRNMLRPHNRALKTTDPSSEHELQSHLRPHSLCFVSQCYRGGLLLKSIGTKVLMFSKILVQEWLVFCICIASGLNVLRDLEGYGLKMLYMTVTTWQPLQQVQ